MPRGRPPKRPVKYVPESQEMAFGLYMRGITGAAAVKEMRLLYPSFSQATWTKWIKKFDWEKRRAMADAKRREVQDAGYTIMPVLLAELIEVKDGLVGKLRKGDIDPQDVYALDRMVAKIVELVSKHLPQNNQQVALEVLQRAFEELITEMRAIPVLAKPMEQNAVPIGKLAGKVAEKYGRAA